jgi:hypothetical protein
MDVILSGERRFPQPATQGPSIQMPRSNGMTVKEREVIEKLAEETELTLESDCQRRDLKEKRSLMKNTLYDGSKKLKHSVPKGKRV